MLHGFSTRDHQVQPGQSLRLSSYPTRIAPFYEDNDSYKARLGELTSELTDLQERLYAHGQWSVLLIFQGMDTSGKDGAIKHVMSGVNPQGCKVISFGKPSPEELDHDFLWRTHRHLPKRGQIGIFNRSYYEEVLVARVHPEILKQQNIPDSLLNLPALWKQRLIDIRNHEDYLSRQGTQILKFFLHISKEEQRQRLIARIDNPSKNWKFDVSDVDERKHWTEYQRAFAECLKSTSTKTCPWYVIPADDKKNARLMVSQILVQSLSKLDLHYPRVGPAQKRELQRLRKVLSRSSPTSGRIRKKS